MNIPMEQRIDLILRRQLPELLGALYGDPPYSREQIRESASFTRTDITDYVDKYGFPEGSYVEGDTGQDGVHLEQKDDFWLLYGQERGCRSLVYKINDESKIKEVMIDLMVYLSGVTGPIAFSPEFQFTPMNDDWTYCVRNTQRAPTV